MFWDLTLDTQNLLGFNLFLRWNKGANRAKNDWVLLPVFIFDAQRAYPANRGILISASYEYQFIKVHENLVQQVKTYRLAHPIGHSHREIEL